ncbi:tRNA dihydrouridine synthase DusB [bacterium]|nr:tRNA dihydrouridine synthase DusB [bacterium]
MIIGNHNFSNTAILAPMAGVADTAFRLICRKYGAAATVSELISAEGLVRANDRTQHLLDFTQAERPYAIQLFGADAAHMAEAAKMAMQRQPDWIDLNFGCPVKKVTKRGAGSAVMKDLPLMQDIIHQVVEAVDLPVTVKIRSGWDNSSINADEAAKIIEGEGAAAVTIHARTRQQAFKGKADLNIISLVKQAVSIPVIGNGDIFCGKDAMNMINQTDCDAVMVGRGSYGRPWIFNQINHYISTGTELADPPAVLRIDTCLEHYRLALETLPTARAVNEMRKHIGWYVRGLRGASHLRQTVFHLTDPQEVCHTLMAFRNEIHKDEEKA